MERMNDLPCDLQLELQRIGSFTIEAFCPDLRLITNKDELRNDANVAPRGTETSLHNRSHTESSANLGDRFRRGILSHRGGAGDNAKTLRIESGKLKNDFFGQPDAQQIQLRVICEIDKRQNVQASPCGGKSWSGGT